jgi:hypothetical protein
LCFLTSNGPFLLALMVLVPVSSSTSSSLLVPVSHPRSGSSPLSRAQWGLNLFLLALMVLPPSPKSLGAASLLEYTYSLFFFVPSFSLTKATVLSHKKDDKKCIRL